MKETDLIKDMESAINEVVNGDAVEAKLVGVYPADVKNYVEKLKGIESDEMDINGWEWDFWMYYTIEDTKYVLSGSGYYGSLVFREDN